MDRCAEEDDVMTGVFHLPDKNYMVELGPLLSVGPAFGRILWSEWA